MYRKILVGYGADRHAEGALTLARLLAQPEAVEEAVVLEAHEKSDFAGQAPPIPRDAAGARLTPTSDWPSHVRVTHRIASGGSPAETLSKEADQEGADVVVLGATHRHTLGRMLFGTTAGSVLRGAKWPVVVAPDGYSRSSAPLAELAVAVDGSEEAGAALAWAVSVAAAFSAKLRLLTVVEATPPIDTWGQDIPAETWGTGFSPDQADQILEGVRSRLAPELAAAEATLGEGRAELVTIVGDAQQELRHAAESVQMLVVGSHGKGRAGGVLLGSVSHGLSRSCPAPLAVVPTPPAGPGGPGTGAGEGAAADSGATSA